MAYKKIEVAKENSTAYVLSYVFVWANFALYSNCV